MSLNFYNASNNYVHINENDSSVYSISYIANTYYHEMSSFYKRYGKNLKNFPYPCHSLWSEVVLPEDPGKNIPHLFDINMTHLYTYPNKIIEDAYNDSVSPSIPTQLYPIATRYIDSNGVYYIERPPFQVDIDYKIGCANSRTNKRVSNKKLWIPWTLFIFNPQEMSTAKMVFSHKSLTNESDLYISTFLPNTYPDGKICYSNSLNSIPDIDPNYRLSINETYSLMINEYFAGSWNADLTNSWQVFYEYFYQQVIKFFPEDIDLYPQMKKFFNPSLEFIQSNFSPKNPIYKTISTLYKFNKNNFLSSLDHVQCHEYILTTLSSYSLQETLALIEEACSLYTQYKTPDHKYRTKFFNKEHYSNSFPMFDKDTFYMINTFQSLTKSASSSYATQEQNLSYSVSKIIDQLCSIPVLKNIPSEYNSFQTKIMFYNDEHYVDPYYLRSPDIVNAYYTCNFLSSIDPKVFFTLMNMIIEDYRNGISISQNAYCYDLKSQTFHVIPYSIEIYKQIVTDYTQSQFHISEYAHDKV